jgi:hypothetical protein
MANKFNLSILEFVTDGGQESLRIYTQGTSLAARTTDSGGASKLPVVIQSTAQNAQVAVIYAPTEMGNYVARILRDGVCTLSLQPSHKFGDVYVFNLLVQGQPATYSMSCLVAGITYSLCCDLHNNNELCLVENTPIHRQRYVFGNVRVDTTTERWQSADIVPLESGAPIVLGLIISILINVLCVFAIVVLVRWSTK